jgi:hypothetical protein
MVFWVSTAGLGCKITPGRIYIYIVWMEYVPDDVNLPTAGHSERGRESIMKEWLELSYRTLDSIMHGRSGL